MFVPSCDSSVEQGAAALSKPRFLTASSRFTSISLLLRWIVLKDDLSLSVLLHAKLTSVALGQNRPLHVDGEGVQVMKTSCVSRQDRARCLHLTSKLGLLLKGGGGMGHFIL